MQRHLIQSTFLATVDRSLLSNKPVVLDYVRTTCENRCLAGYRVEQIDRLFFIGAGSRNNTSKMTNVFTKQDDIFLARLDADDLGFRIALVEEAAEGANVSTHVNHVFWPKGTA